MKKVLGAVTIGQAPRTDLTPEIREILGSEVEIKEAGALDGLSREEIAEFAPGPDDSILVTRLADGSPVKVAERNIFPLLREKVDGLYREEVPVVVLLCTGEFPSFPTPGLLVKPQPVLYNVTRAVAEGLKIGVLVPAPDQIEEAKVRWRGVGREQVVLAASPYGDQEKLKTAAYELADANVELVVLDCMGYTLAMQQLVRDVVGVPVILARGIVARVLKEILG